MPLCGNKIRFWWNHIFEQGDFPCGRQVRPYRLGMTALHSAPRATVHVQPLHPRRVNSTFLSQSPCWSSRFSLKKKKLTFTTALTGQLCAISSSIFCKLSFWLPRTPHRLSDPKRTLHYESLESGLAPTKPTQMLLPKLLQPVQAKSGKLRR